jgi:hypothetical protein
VTTIWWTEGGLTRKSLHVGFGWRPAEHVRIDVNESQILALLVGEALPAGMMGVA